jgi:hypothetical protein
MIDDDEIDQALSGAADDADEATRKRARSGKLWLTAPAKNSPEIELRAMKYEDRAPVSDVAFGDEAEHEKMAADPEWAREQSGIAQLFDHHISLARSLPENATWLDYAVKCKAEGVEPMPRYAGRS